MYRGSNISSTESYVNIRLGKAWATIDLYGFKYSSNDHMEI